jgi:pterin-4a-carbinolamine dehydratase
MLGRLLSRRLRCTVMTVPTVQQCHRTFAAAVAATRLTDVEKAEALRRLSGTSAAIPGSGLKWEKVFKTIPHVQGNVSTHQQRVICCTQDPSGRDAIQKTYHFTDFKMAWTWMSKIAELAEEMQHHPEWFNVYNMVDVKLTTHDCKGLSTLVRNMQHAKSLTNEI